MLWSKKTPLLLMLMLTLTSLTACGFKPLYQNGAPTTAAVQNTPLLSTIFIAPIADKEGQILRNLLMDRFYQNGIPTSRRYELVIDNMRADYTDLGLRRDATKTRQQLRLSVNAALHDRENGQVLFTRSLRTVNGFNILDSQFSNIISRDDALARSLSDLSEQITLQTQLFLTHKQNATSPLPEMNKAP